MERPLDACGYGMSYIAFFCKAEDGIRVVAVTGVQTCAFPILALFELGTNLLSTPTRNRVSQATQIRSGLEYRQAQMRIQQLENQVRIEVRNAQFAVQQNRRSEERRVGKECRSRWSAEH